MSDLATNDEFPELGCFQIELETDKILLAVPKDEPSVSFSAGKDFDTHNVIGLNFEALDTLQVSIDQARWMQASKTDVLHQEVVACFEVWDRVNEKLVARVRTEDQAQKIVELLASQEVQYVTLKQCLFVDGTVKRAQAIEAYIKTAGTKLDGKHLLKLFADQTSFSYLTKYSSGDLQLIGNTKIVALDLENNWFRDDCQDDPIRFDALVLICMDRTHQDALNSLFLEQDKEYHVNALPTLLSDMMDCTENQILSIHDCLSPMSVLHCCSIRSKEFLWPKRKTLQLSARATPPSPKMTAAVTPSCALIQTNRSMAAPVCL